MFKTAAIAISLTLLFFGTATAQGFTSITDIQVATDLAHVLAADKKKRVLVVFDIDDTILTTPQDLGSEGWLGQHMDQIKSDSEAEAHDTKYEALFYEQALWLKLSRLKPTQPNGPELVKGLQGAGIPVFTLSARDQALRGDTERALKAAGYDFATAPECAKPLCTRRGALTDVQVRKAAARLNVAIADEAYDPVTVSDGVMLVSGQDKGVFVQLLAGSLHKKPYTDIIFVDDSRRNIENVVRAASEMKKTKIHVFRYERIWPRNEALHTDPVRQKAADRLSDAIRATICAGFDNGLCEYSYGFGQ